MVLLIDWEFTCPVCTETSTVQTNISKRVETDKPTVKPINTAVGCKFCKEVTLFETLQHIKEAKDFDWQPSI